MRYDNIYITYQNKFKFTGLSSLVVVIVQLDVFLIILYDNLFFECCVMVLQLLLKLT